MPALATGSAATRSAAVAFRSGSDADIALAARIAIATARDADSAACTTAARANQDGCVAGSLLAARFIQVATCFPTVDRDRIRPPRRGIMGNQRAVDGDIRGRRSVESRIPGRGRILSRGAPGACCSSTRTRHACCPGSTDASSAIGGSSCACHACGACSAHAATTTATETRGAGDAACSSPAHNSGVDACHAAGAQRWAAILARAVESSCRATRASLAKHGVKRCHYIHLDGCIGLAVRTSVVDLEARGVAGARDDSGNENHHTGKTSAQVRM
jgi:hypothetical protein